MNNRKLRDRYSNIHQLENIRRKIENYKSILDPTCPKRDTFIIEIDDSRLADFVESYMTEYPDANEYILEFIEEFLFKAGKDGVRYIMTVFCRGYCYYFAKMLREAFPNGTIWVSLDVGHIVFVDGDNPLDYMCYDVRGVVSDLDVHELCPIEIFGEFLVNYMHLPYVDIESHGKELYTIANTWRENGSKSISELLKDAEGNY